MLKRNLSFIFIALYILIFLSISGNSHICYGENTGTIKIGVILAKTGNAAFDAAPGFKVAHFAANEINAKGGINGEKIEIAEFDNHSTPLGARLAAERAVKAKVSGVVGAVWSSHSLAMAKVLQKAKIPMVSPSSTNPRLTLIGNYIFRVCFPDTFQGKVMSDFALNYLKAETAVVLTNANSKYSMGLAKYFINNFNKKGRVLWENDYADNTIDFTSQLEKVKSLNPDIAFVPDHYRESAYIIKQGRNLGLKLTFLGGDGWLNQMYKYGGNSIEGNFYVAQWDVDCPNAASRKFVKKYSAVNGTADQPVMALTYDAFNVLADAIKKAGNTNTKNIRDCLARTDNFPGVTGKISFDKNGDPVNKTAVILKFKNSRSIYFKTISPFNTKGKNR